MHELSIALSIIEGAEEEMRRQGAGRVFAVHVRLGALSGIVADALTFSYELACEGTALQGSSLVIEEMPIRLYCAACHAENAPVSPQHLHCRKCGSSACNVVQGSELELTALELDG